jgi:hypothetical protein
LRKFRFNAAKIEREGKKWDSLAEYQRFKVLEISLHLGEIADLRCQVHYLLEVNGQPISEYIADFVYYTQVGERWIQIVEDVKGVRTPEYRLKKKLMKAIWNIEITETTDSKPKKKGKKK